MTTRTIHCTTCHEPFTPDGRAPYWDYADEFTSLVGFGICAPCNTESQYSASWALAVGAVTLGELQESCPNLALCLHADELIWEGPSVSEVIR